MNLFLIIVIVIGAIALFLLADLGVAWIIVKGLELAFGLQVDIWGMFLLVLAFNILIATIKERK